MALRMTLLLAASITLKTHFRPEFLNRIDDVIVFHELTMDEVKQIVDLFLYRVREQLESQALDLALTEDAKELMAKLPAWSER